eukprot:gene4330-3144_t
MRCLSTRIRGACVGVSSRAVSTAQTSFAGSKNSPWGDDGGAATRPAYPDPASAFPQPQPRFRKTHVEWRLHHGNGAQLGQYGASREVADYEFDDGTPASISPRRFAFKHHQDHLLVQLIRAGAVVERFEAAQQLPRVPGTKEQRDWDPEIPLFLDDLDERGPALLEERFDGGKGKTPINTALRTRKPGEEELEANTMFASYDPASFVNDVVPKADYRRPYWSRRRWSLSDNFMYNHPVLLVPVAPPRRSTSPRPSGEVVEPLLHEHYSSTSRRQWVPMLRPSNRQAEERRKQTNKCMCLRYQRLENCQFFSVFLYWLRGTYLYILRTTFFSQFKSPVKSLVIREKMEVDEDAAAPGAGAIQVVLRKRPIIEGKEDGENDVVRCLGRSNVTVYEPKMRLDLTPVIEPSSFEFDVVFDETSSNAQIYKECCQPLLHNVRCGGGAVVFAFGQTGSGKTFTMLGGGQSPGLYGLAVTELLSMKKGSDPLTASFFEVYGTKLYDLLNDRAELKLLQDEYKNIHVVGLTQTAVNSAEDVKSLMISGQTLRAIGTTHANDRSSRSHAELKTTNPNISDAPVPCGNCGLPIFVGDRHVCRRMQVQCPHCRQEMEKTDLETHVTECKEVPMRCPYCNERMLRGDQGKHSRRCTKAPMRCQNCNQQVPRHQMEKHTLSDCTATREKCRYCRMPFPRALLHSHELNCDAMMMACEHCLQFVRRSKMEGHLQQCLMNPNKTKMGRRGLGGAGPPSISTPVTSPPRMRSSASQMPSGKMADGPSSELSTPRRGPTTPGAGAAPVEHSGSGAAPSPSPTVLPCPYSRYGCQSKITQRNLSSHLEECVRDHLELVTKYADRIDLQNAELRRLVVGGTQLPPIRRPPLTERRPRAPGNGVAETVSAVNTPMGRTHKHTSHRLAVAKAVFDTHNPWWCIFRLLYFFLNLFFCSLFVYLCLICLCIIISFYYHFVHFYLLLFLFIFLSLRDSVVPNVCLAVFFSCDGGGGRCYYSPRCEHRCTGDAQGKRSEAPKPASGDSPPYHTRSGTHIGNVPTCPPHHPSTRQRALRTKMPLTADELKEIHELHRGNEILATEIGQLVARIAEAKERRKECFMETDVETHQSKLYIREIKGMQRDAAIIDLVQRWRAARLQCAAYSETIEEVRNNFLEMKRLYEQLQKSQAKSKP